MLKDALLDKMLLKAEKCKAFMLTCLISFIYGNAGLILQVFF